MRKALRITVSSVVWLATAAASLAFAPVGESIKQTCGTAGVMAVVDKIPGRCFVVRHGQMSAPRRLAAGGAAFADEIIKCEVSGELRLTFCATRAQKIVPLDKGHEYRVPVVTKNPEEPKEALDEAARVAEAKNVPIFKNLLATSDLRSSPRIPTCDKKLGTLAVGNAERDWWTAYNLDSPDSLIRLFAAKSNCFNVVDRKGGMSEQARANHGDRQVKGQLKSVDYLLVADFVQGDGKNSENAITEFLGHPVGALVGGVNQKRESAQVLLALTDARSTEQVALESGYASKTTLSKLSNNRRFFREIAAAGAGYANTEIGRVVTLAYLDSFSKLVNNAKTQFGASYVDGAPRSVTVASGGQVHVEPDINAKAIRDVAVGVILYPTGEKRGLWWKVTDELGNRGWVLSTLLVPEQ